MGSIILSLILATLILFSSLRVTLTYTYYELDPIGFIENLCKNKDEPDLECNGKCHLKKIAESQKQDKKTPESIIDFKELILFSNTLEVFVFQQKEFIKKQKPVDYQNLYSFMNINNCFHPPQV